MSDADDVDEIADYRRRLDQLMPHVRELLPAWTPKHFKDADVDSYMCYVATVEEALEHAKFADLESLQSGLFYDGITDADYYLEFTRDPTPAELLAFQAGLFQAYLLAESEKFDHLAILKRTLPMIKVSIV